MKPVDQTKFGSVDGDCLPARIASLLELDIADVPNFCATEPDGSSPPWCARLNAWLRPRGLLALPLDVTGDVRWEVFGDAWLIVSGPSPRGPWLHATVWRHGQPVHDPHPSRAFLAGSPSDIIVFVCLDPRGAE